MFNYIANLFKFLFYIIIFKNKILTASINENNITLFKISLNIINFKTKTLKEAISTICYRKNIVFFIYLSKIIKPELTKECLYYILMESVKQDSLVTLKLLEKYNTISCYYIDIVIKSTQLKKYKLIDYLWKDENFKVYLRKNNIEYFNILNKKNLKSKITNF